MYTTYRYEYPFEVFHHDFRQSSDLFLSGGVCSTRCLGDAALVLFGWLLLVALQTIKSCMISSPEEVVYEPVGTLENNKVTVQKSRISHSCCST